MPKMTYGELFDEYLANAIRAGGEVERVARWVDAYQGRDVGVRREVFREWLEEASLACGRCGLGFGPKVEETEETQDVLCVWCVHGYLGADREPVPGWRRTWSRL